MATVASINTNLTATTGNLEKGIKRGQQVIKGFAGRMRGMAFALPDANRLIAGSIAALGIRRIFGEVKEQLDSLGNLFDRAISIGIEPQKLQALEFAGKLAGVEAEAVGTALTKMGRKISEAASGGKEASEVFERLGLSAEQLRGLSPDQQFGKIADALAAIKNPTDRVRVAMDLFGRTGANMISMLSEGSRGLNVATAEFERLGGTLTDVDIAAADLAGDALTGLNAAFDNFKKNIIVGASPAIVLFSQSLGNMIGATGEAAKSQFALARAYFEVNAVIGNLINSIGSRLASMGILFDPKDKPAGGWTQESRAASSAKLAGVLAGPTKASDILGEQFEAIVKDIERAAERAKAFREIGSAIRDIDNVDKDKKLRDRRERDVDPGAIEKGTAKAIEAANKALGARTEQDVQKKILREEQAANGVLRDIRRALANRPNVVAANLG